MSKHTVREGETLASIAQRYLGNPARAQYLFDYNNGCKSGNINIIYPGEVINIPRDMTEKTTILPVLTDVQKGEVVISVNGKSFHAWDSAEIVRNLDTSADGFSLSVKYRGDSPPDDFLPFTYPPCQISVDGELILTGRVEHVRPSFSGGEKSIAIQGRSLTGWLLDLPVTKRPGEFNDMTLEDIASYLAGLYGVKTQFLDPPGAPYPSAICKHGEVMQDFLNRLALERGLFCTASPRGELLFQRAKKLSPAAALIEGENILSCSATYDGTQRFSEIIADSTQSTGRAIQAKAFDSLLQSRGINRPRMISPENEPEKEELKNIARWEMNKYIGNSMNFAVELSGWKTPAGKVWKEGETVTLTAPSLYLTRATQLIIKCVKLSVDNSQKKTSLSLMIPETYTLEDC